MSKFVEEVGTIRVDPQALAQDQPAPPLTDELRHFLDPGPEWTLGRLGHYDILEVLGQGAFGIVVKGRDRTLQRLVAIKLLLPRLALTSPPRKYFLREARAAAKVQQENVVQIFGVEEAPFPYLVMEYIDGETLQDRLDRVGPIDSAEAVRIGRQIAQGLAAAHANGVIHRDIKPANILLEKGEPARVKITDFGIARAVDDASISQSGVVGTPMYIAPEQVSGGAVDYRSDLFSLGSVLYTMVAGRPPFRAGSTIAVLKRVAEETPRNIREINPEVHPGVCAVIGRLHAKEPEDRFATAQEVVEALDRCLTQPTVHRAVQSSRRRWPVAAAVVLMLTGASGLVAASLFGSTPTDEKRTEQTQAPNPAPVAPEPKPAPIAPEPKPAPVAPEPKPTSTTPELKPAPVPEGPREKLPSAEWEKYVAQLPAHEQVPAIDARLRFLNPRSDYHQYIIDIKDGAVDKLHFFAKNMSDLSPIRALPKLRNLSIQWQRGEPGGYQATLRELKPLAGMKLEQLTIHNSNIQDLSPLKGMPLWLLSIWSFDGDDLAPLRGMKLRVLNCGDSPVRNLEPLRGMPLTFLCINMSPVEDLSPLRDAPLTELLIEHTKVTDLTPVLKAPIHTLLLKGAKIRDIEDLPKLPLQAINIDFDWYRHPSILQKVSTLRTVNGRPASEFAAKAEPGKK